MSVLDTIGNTRLVPLRRLVPEGGARVLLKLEYENPTGSMKDRMACAMVEARKSRHGPTSRKISVKKDQRSAPTCRNPQAIHHWPTKSRKIARVQTAWATEKRTRSRCWT